MSAEGFCAGLQAFMQGAGEQGVLLIALGTVTETSEPQFLTHYPLKQIYILENISAL